MTCRWRAEGHAIEKCADRCEARRAVFRAQLDVSETRALRRRPYLLHIRERARALRRRRIDALPLQRAHDRGVTAVRIERTPDRRDEPAGRLQHAPDLREARGTIGKELQALQAEA